MPDLRPWLTEPATFDGTAHGLSYHLRRGPLGHWCGYVGVAEGHPAFGKDYDNIEADVHGGLTYANNVLPLKRHSSVYWYLGFDCAHSGDLIPEIDGHKNMGLFSTGTYRTFEYAQNEAINLARQLSEMKS